MARAMASPTRRIRRLHHLGLLPLLLLLLLWTTTTPAPFTQASLPSITCPPDSTTNCTLSNSYREWADRQPCRVAQVHYPRTETELVAAVAKAVRAGSHIKLVSKTSHSFPKLACPGGPSGSGTLISTRDMLGISINASAMTVTVAAGVHLRELIPELAAAGLAFPYTPYWYELSVSGMLASGAHGSSMWGKGSAMHEYVTAVRVVVPASEAEGYAKVVDVTAEKNPRELAAWKVHLGVLGAVASVTLQVQPQFKRALTFDTTSDGELERRVLEIARDHEFGDVSWYPAQRLVRYRYDGRVPASTPGDGVFENFTPLPVAAVEAFRAADLATEAARDAPGQCARAAAIQASAAAAGYGAATDRRNTSIFSGFPIVSTSEFIQSSGACSAGPADSSDPFNPTNLICLWDLGRRGAFFYNNAVSIPLTAAPAFVRDVKRLVQLRPHALCDLGIYGGMVIRYVRGESSALLGHAVDSVDIDFTFKRADEARVPVVDGDVFAEVEQILVRKYGGTPHWAKGRPVAFEGVSAKYGDKVKEFLKIREEVDPEGVFASEWTDAVLGVRGSVTADAPGCALEGLCLCKKDVHCAPEKGYFCRRGLVYKQARVCRFEGARGVKS